MAADRYRTQTLVIVALAALFICAGSITAGVFVYDRLQARANPTPAAGVQALSAQGLLVTAVVPGSPADGALQRGDILLQAADRPLRTPRDLQLELTALPPDSPKVGTEVLHREGLTTEALHDAELTDTEWSAEISYEGLYELDDSTLADGSVLDDHFGAMGGWVAATLVRLGDLTFQFLPSSESDA